MGNSQARTSELEMKKVDEDEVLIGFPASKVLLRTKNIVIMSALAPAPLLCPTCTEPFTSISGLCVPSLLSCGHCVCAPCADGLTKAVLPLCTLCSSRITTTFVPNHSLADVIATGVRLDVDTVAVRSFQPSAPQNDGRMPLGSSSGPEGNVTTSGLLPPPPLGRGERRRKDAVKERLDTCESEAGAVPSLEKIRSECDASAALLSTAADEVRECTQRVRANAETAVRMRTRM